MLSLMENQVTYLGAKIRTQAFNFGPLFLRVLAASLQWLMVLLNAAKHVHRHQSHVTDSVRPRAQTYDLQIAARSFLCSPTCPNSLVQVCQALGVDERGKGHRNGMGMKWTEANSWRQQNVEEWKGNGRTRGGSLPAQVSAAH